MEKREIMLYAITVVSLIAVTYIALGAITKIPNIANERFMSLTGNIVLELENNFKTGDNIHGNIIIAQEETNNYGVLLLTKDNKPLVIKTFNLKDISKNKINSGYSIKIEDLVDYKFSEKGDYELLFSVLELDINIKREFAVE